MEYCQLRSLKRGIPVYVNPKYCKDICEFKNPKVCMVEVRAFRKLEAAKRKRRKTFERMEK